MSKEKFQIEFLAKSSPNILYNQIATVSGLSEWFADNVNIKEDILLFTWDGDDEEAKLIARKKDQFIKLTEPIKNSEYGKYLIKILNQNI